MYYIGNIQCVPSDIQHHGILGMKWGVRRYQNSDGSLTNAGKNRYNVYARKTGKKYEFMKKLARSQETKDALDREKQRAMDKAQIRHIKALKLGMAVAAGLMAYTISKKLIGSNGGMQAIGKLRTATTDLNDQRLYREQMKLFAKAKADYVLGAYGDELYSAIDMIKKDIL